MVSIIFKGGIIQKGDRVKIPKAIIDTLELKAGDKIEIRFDAEKRLILVEEVDKKSYDESKSKGKKRK